VAYADRLDLIDKHYRLSCYCFGLARIFERVDRPTDGLILLHRAIDLFFQYLGLQEKLIVISLDGLRYAHDRDERIIVSLRSTENFLVEKNILVVDRDRSNFLSEINAVRNQLLYTHGASSPVRDNLSDKMKAATAIIRHLEDDNRWVTITNELFATPSLEENAIFDAMDDIETYFEVVPVP
jgi:hypothetical protein